jgi:hypothetical protein
MPTVTVLTQEFFNAEKVSYLLQVTPRTLNRWASNPEAYPEYAAKLAPKTLISGRRMYPVENILAVYNETFDRSLTLDELKRELRTHEASLRVPQNLESPADEGELEGVA